jgi:predicted metalloendopeptidase
LRAAELEFARRMNKIGKPVDQTELFMMPSTVNAFINVHMNEIVFSTGICNHYSTIPRPTTL